MTVLYNETIQDEPLPGTQPTETTSGSSSQGISSSTENINPIPAQPQTEFNKPTLNSPTMMGNSVFTGGWLRSGNFVTGLSGWEIQADGDVEFNDGVFRGSLIAGSIDIPDTTSTNSFHVDTNGNAWWGTNVATGYATAPASILNTGAATFSSINITGGTIGSGASVALGALNIAAQGWTQTCSFSITDADTIAWGSGNFTTATGTVYAITGANTGNMSAKTYIYLDTAISTTAYQTTTTAGTAVGAGKVLVAIAQNGTGEATYQVMAGQGGQNIDAGSIVANSITANELSTSITYAGAIIIDTSGLIRSGQTAYDTGTGWWLGNVGGTPKFSIGVGGSTAESMTWDGTSLNAPGFMRSLTSGTYNTTATNATFTADDTNDTITSNGHNLQDGDKVTLTTTGTLPAGLSLLTGYFVRDRTANTFKLSATPFAVVINITGTGTGTHTWTNANGSITLTFPARKQLKIVADIKTPTGSSMVRINLNGDGGQNYGYLISADSGVPSNDSDIRFIDKLAEATEDANPKYSEINVTNIATTKKLGNLIGSNISGNNSLGSYTSGVFCWNNTSDQITSITIWLNTRFSMGSSSTVYVYGSN